MLRGVVRSSLLLAFLSACAVARAQEGPADAGGAPGEIDAGEPGAEQPGEAQPQEEEEQEEEPLPAPPPGVQADEPATPVEAESEADPTMQITEVQAEEDEGLKLAFGMRAGYALQPDQYVAGPHLRVRGILADFVELDAMVLAGMATEHWTLRISAHLKLIISAGDFRFFPLLGPAAFVYQPRGQFADWCDKLDLECSSSAFGMELGLGAGWRALGVEAYLSTGELPLLTILGSVTLEL